MRAGLACGVGVRCAASPGVPGGSRPWGWPRLRAGWAVAHAQSDAGAGRAARGKPAWTRERETPRAEAGKGRRMRRSALRAGRDGEGEVESPRRNLTRWQPRPWRRARRPLRPQRGCRGPGPHVLGGELRSTQ